MTKVKELNDAAMTKVKELNGEAMTDAAKIEAVTETDRINSTMTFSKRQRLWLLAAVITAGSFITFYASNLLLSDVANMFMMTITRDVFSSLPLFMVACEFILAGIGIIRNQRRPEYRKAQLKNYMMITVILSFIGLVSTIVTGTSIYGSFLAPYPFRGCTILCLLWHFAAIVLAFVFIKRIGNLPPDPKIRRKTVRYRVHTFFLTLGMFLAYNRFGALLWMPAYVHMRSLCLTWPFYLSLLLPLAVVADNIIYAFDLDNGKPYFGVKYISIVIAADILLAGTVFLIGMKNSLFISAISPALGLERLATMPVETIAIYGLVLILGVYSLLHALKKSRKIGRNHQLLKHDK